MIELEQIQLEVASLLLTLKLVGITLYPFNKFYNLRAIQFDINLLSN